MLRRNKTDTLFCNHSEIMLLKMTVENLIEWFFFSYLPRNMVLWLKQMCCLPGRNDSKECCSRSEDKERRLKWPTWEFTQIIIFGNVTSQPPAAITLANQMPLQKVLHIFHACWTCRVENPIAALASLFWHWLHCPFLPQMSKWTWIKLWLIQAL